jgi:hypothetical protein
VEKVYNKQAALAEIVNKINHPLRLSLMLRLKRAGKLKRSLAKAGAVLSTLSTS